MRVECPRSSVLLKLRNQLFIENLKIFREIVVTSLRIIKKEMESANLPILNLNVPLIADTNFGNNWDEAH